MYNIKQNDNQTTIEFIQPTAEMLEKTAPYETVGVKNVMKSMASEFLRKERTDFLVYVTRLERWFHFKKHTNQDIVSVELTGVVSSAGDLQDICANGSYGMYENNGILTKEIIETELH